jgi:hypothetical protein
VPALLGASHAAAYGVVDPDDIDSPNRAQVDTLRGGGLYKSRNQLTRSLKAAWFQPLSL